MWPRWHGGAEPPLALGAPSASGEARAPGERRGARRHHPRGGGSARGASARPRAPTAQLRFPSRGLRRSSAWKLMAWMAKGAAATAREAQTACRCGSPCASLCPFSGPARGWLCSTAEPVLPSTSLDGGLWQRGPLDAFGSCTPFVCGEPALSFWLFLVVVLGLCGSGGTGFGPGVGLQHPSAKVSGCAGVWWCAGVV